MHCNTAYRLALSDDTSVMPIVQLQLCQAYILS